MNPSPESSSPPPGSPPFQVLASRHFPAWLAEQKVSLALSTYQTGKLFLIGFKSHDRLSVFERTFNRAMGLWSDGQTLWLAAAFQLWRLENAYLTPHNAALSFPGAIVGVFADNYRRFVAGQPLQHAVDFERGY